MDSDTRNEIARKHHYCINCLARTHRVRNCNSPDNCLKCGLLHHTLLHPTRHPRIEAPKGSVRERIGIRYQSTKRFNRKRLHRKKATRSLPQQADKPTTTSQPNQLVLSEAIRSLAAVLCATSSSSK